jgi:hypothetical protein
MWTTVSTCAWSITRAMIGLRMSARTNSTSDRTLLRADHVNADDPLDPGFAGKLLGHQPAEVSSGASDQDDPRHATPSRSDRTAYFLLRRWTLVRAQQLAVLLLCHPLAALLHD